MKQTSISAQQCPEETGIWVFITIDLVLFAVYFLLAAHDIAHLQPAKGEAAHSLSQAAGVLNTVILLTGSWAVAMGSRASASTSEAARYFAAATATGLAFLLVKAFEYGDHIAAGDTITSSVFFTWYYVLTGLHAIHLVVGTALLAFISRRFRSSERVSGNLQSGACYYWHLIDLLWIGIFTVIYLLPVQA